MSAVARIARQDGMENCAPKFTLRCELKDTFNLAGPIVLNQVGMMSMGIVDTMVAGRISTTALAGLGLASNVFHTFVAVCAGMIFGLDAFFSQAVGARDERGLARYLGQAFWMCLLVIVVSTASVVAGSAIYARWAAPDDIRAAVMVYVRTIIWCVPGLYFHFLLQRYWQARHRVLPFTLMIIGGNVLNFVGNLALGMGWWGFPRLEVQGLALATVISRYGMLLASALYTWRQLRPAAWRLPRIDWSVQRSFFRLGLPAAGHTGLEIGAFAIATFVVGTLGAVALAAHHVCLMMASFTFMFPVGFSSAAAVRVGLFVGARQPERARLAGWLCIGSSVAVMSLFAGGYLALPRLLLRGFTQDAAVVDLGARILVVVALFQIADGIQVSTTGALRGLGNTRAALIANLIGHYPIGLALGLVLCYVLHFGVLGIWAGLATGLIGVAGMLLVVWSRVTQDPTTLRPLAERA